MSLQNIDDAATAFVNGFAGRSPALDAVMVAVTSYGAYAIVAAVAVRWWWTGGADKLRERHLAILCGASAVLGLAINQGVLLFIHRPRPYAAHLTRLLIPPSADPSFPSDHATLGFAVAFALLGAGARRGSAFLLAAAVLSISRVYVGTHYLSDVGGGALTGAVAALICLFLIKPDSWATRVFSRIL